MLRRVHGGMFAVAGFTALAWAGDDAKTYDIDWHEHWKAGQVVTVTEHETSDTDTSMGGKSMQKEHEVVEATYVVRCDAADAEGNPTKRTVFLKSWKKTKDAAADESLSGALVTVDGKSWKIADGRKTGSVAKKWLDHEFTKDDNPLPKLAPPKMSVGQTWKPDGKTVAEAFAKALDDAPFDASGVTMEITLVSAQGTPPDASGKFDYKLHLPITNLPGLPQGSTLGAGSGAEGTGDHTGPLTTSTMLGTEHMEMELNMVVNLPKETGGVSATTKGHISTTKSTVAGGEIPAAPTPPAPPAVPKPPAPAPGGK